MTVVLEELGGGGGVGALVLGVRVGGLEVVGGMVDITGTT